MKTIQDGVRSMEIILSLNWDRVLFGGGILLALAAAAGLLHLI